MCVHTYTHACERVYCKKHTHAHTQVFGKDQPIALQLLGSERSYEALEGVAMELEDSLYPLLREVSCPTYPTISLCCTKKGVQSVLSVW